MSYDAQTRTSGFVRDVVDASLPFHAVAVYVTFPEQSIVALISEWHAAAVDASQPAMHTRHTSANSPFLTLPPRSGPAPPCRSRFPALTSPHSALSS